MELLLLKKTKQTHSLFCFSFPIQAPSWWWTALGGHLGRRLTCCCRRWRKMTRIASTSTITYPAETVPVLALWMSTWRWMGDHRAIPYGTYQGLLQKDGWKQNSPSVLSGHIFIRYEFVIFFSPLNIWLSMN